MALWHILSTDEQFDDGLTAKPGEEGFTRELAEEHANGGEFNYIGTPNWSPPAGQEPQE